MLRRAPGSVRRVLVPGSPELAAARVHQQQGGDVSAQRGAVNLVPAAALKCNAEGKRQTGCVLRFQLSEFRRSKTSLLVDERAAAVFGKAEAGAPDARATCCFFTWNGALCPERLHTCLSACSSSETGREGHAQKEETSSARAGWPRQGAECLGRGTSASRVCCVVRTGRERKPPSLQQPQRNRPVDSAHTRDF